MTPGELEDKFRGLVVMALPEGQIEGLIQIIAGLEDTDDITRLSSFLVARKGTRVH